MLIEIRFTFSKALETKLCKGGCHQTSLQQQFARGCFWINGEFEATAGWDSVENEEEIGVRVLCGGRRVAKKMVGTVL